MTTAGQPDATALGIDVRPLTADDWPLVEALFGRQGACGGCWCQYWHAPPGEAAWTAAKGEPNRRRLQATIEEGSCAAVVALAGDEPVGWCRLGATAEFPRLLRSRKLRRDNMADWAVVCFYIAPSARGAGVATRLLDRAARLAFERGARSVEGYPAVPRSGRLPGPFAWTGVPALFEAAGFTPLPHDAGSRRVYRRERSPG
jgi:GNAT superfamily N-acetyltransferase